MVAVISSRPCSANCVGTMAMCIPTALKMTPRNMATDCKTTRHTLAHFSYAFQIMPFKFRLPPPPIYPLPLNLFGLSSPPNKGASRRAREQRQ